MALKPEYDSKKECTNITQKALSGRGFVLFAAVLTDRKDKHGNLVLDFHYTRSKYPFEDLRKAVEGFAERCRNDMLGIMIPGK